MYLRLLFKVPKSCKSMKNLKTFLQVLKISGVCAAQTASRNRRYFSNHIALCAKGNYNEREAARLCPKAGMPPVITENQRGNSNGFTADF